MLVLRFVDLFVGFQPSGIMLSTKRVASIAFTARFEVCAMLTHALRSLNMDTTIINFKNDNVNSARHTEAGAVNRPGCGGIYCQHAARATRASDRPQGSLSLCLTFISRLQQRHESAYLLQFLHRGPFRMNAISPAMSVKSIPREVRLIDLSRNTSKIVIARVKTSATPTNIVINAFHRLP